MQKLSSVFKEAKEYLWGGTFKGWESNEESEEFICHAIDKVGRTALEHRAKEIIQYRLGVTEQGAFRTVTCYLTDVLDVGWSDRCDDMKVQKYRKDWLTSLEKEFKEIERRFPKGVHHLDGDKNNWDLSNLVGVENWIILKRFESYFRNCGKLRTL
jgi:hypothetical protein